MVGAATVVVRRGLWDLTLDNVAIRGVHVNGPLEGTVPAAGQATGDSRVDGELRLAVDDLSAVVDWLDTAGFAAGAG